LSRESDTKEPEEEPSPVDPLVLLRQRVIDTTLTVLAIAMPLISVVILTQRANGIALALGTFTLSFPLLRLFSKRLGFAVSAVLLLGLMVLTCFFIATRGGAAVGNVALSMVIVMLAVLFFGTRGGLCAWAAIVGAFVLAGSLVTSGLVPPIDRAMWDPINAGMWVRETVVLAVFGLVVALTLNYVVSQLHAQAADARRAAEREHAQRLALGLAQSERESEREQRLAAQLALEESRRVEALARLSSGIAHDFNNTLTVIIGAADMARWSVSSDSHALGCIDDITRAAQGAAELTRQLLTLGRRQVTQPVPVSASTLVARLGGQVRRVLPSDISLEVIVGDAGLVVLVDPVQLERSLYNLVLNAKDAMPRGGKLILRTRRGERSGPDATDLVLIDVSDEGQGMDEATQRRIFEPFFTTKEVGRGTGLGLATVEAFARQAGGEVLVASNPGRGTTFTLCLPAKSESDVAPAPAPVARPQTSAAGQRLLVVEDRADVRDNMVRILSHGGFVVSQAEDGDRAMAMLRHPNAFDLMCIDGVMPGTSTAKVIDRARELCPGLRVLLCSGHVEEELLRRGIEAGRYAYLQKPFSAEQLLTSVRELFDRPAGLVS
jgi:signal transduction histidine kinase